MSTLQIDALSRVAASRAEERTERVLCLEPGSDDAFRDAFHAQGQGHGHGHDASPIYQ